MSQTVDASNLFPSESLGSNSVQQEVNDLIEIVKQEREKYYAHKILFELVSDCSGSGLFNEELKEKVERHVFAVKVQPCVEINNFNADEATTVLGLSNISLPELTCEEQCKLKKIIQKALSEQYSTLTSDLAKATGQYSDSLMSHSKCSRGLNPSLSDKTLFEQKLQLNEQLDLYYNQLIIQYEILEDFIKLRLYDLPKLCHENLEKCSLLNKMYCLRAQVLSQKVNYDIFTETKCSLISYKQFIKEIKEQQQVCMYDILKLEELKEKYVQVSCKQFNEILSNYKQYMASYEKIKKVHEQLKLR